MIIIVLYNTFYTSESDLEFLSTKGFFNANDIVILLSLDKYGRKQKNIMLHLFVETLPNKLHGSDL